MHPSVAAIALALTIVFAAVGTILRVEAPPQPASGLSTATSAIQSRAPDDPLRRFYVRAGRGLERLAGQAPADRHTRSRSS